EKSPTRWLTAASIGILLIAFLGLSWQEENFKLLKLDNDMYYTENKDIAQFILANYPQKTVYGQTWVEANLALSFYLGRYVPTLPSNLPASELPSPDGPALASHRVFHRMKRSVYNFPDYLYLAP
ncbi:MAG: hypothetical protein KGJ93_02880, partial [Patescibacteria group bacterium]|nr:hypothetical protein [Patescibacteria group bacterium]